MSAKKIRVLVVDDSAFMRTAVARTLASDPRLEVIGQARDGADGVKQAAALGPDVITMDYNMPRMNGAEAVRAILRERPVPVVMLSAHTMAGAKETMDALSAGAVDFVTKPDGEVSTDLSSVRDELIKKIVAAAGARPMGAARAASGAAGSSPPAATTGRHRTLSSSSSSLPAVQQPSGQPDLGPNTGQRAIPGTEPAVIIAISTGGPAALERVVPRLPGNLHQGVLIVQHMPAQFTAALAERLDGLAALEVREARDGDRIAPGLVLVAPGDRHVVVDRSARLKLNEGPLVNGCRPSADVTLQSAAPVYGPRLTAVVMTGMGRDGAVGAAAVKAAGGRVLAQDRATSVIYGMPRAVAEMGIVDETLALDQIAPALTRQR